MTSGMRHRTPRESSYPPWLMEYALAVGLFAVVAVGLPTRFLGTEVSMIGTQMKYPPMGQSRGLDALFELTASD